MSFGRVVGTLAFVICFSFLTLAQTPLVADSIANKNVYVSVNSRELIASPETYAGRLVSFTGEIISISAGGESLHLYDGRSPMVIGISLSQLKKSARFALVNKPFHHVSVFGRVNVTNGKITLEATRVEKLGLVETVDVAGLSF